MILGRFRTAYLTTDDSLTGRERSPCRASVGTTARGHVRHRAFDRVDREA
jgi:hypothetical protein